MDIVSKRFGKIRLDENVNVHLFIALAEVIDFASFIFLSHNSFILIIMYHLIGAVLALCRIVNQ